MKLLLGTHLLLWAAGEPERLSPAARALLDDPANALLFSAASVWEVATKRGLGRADFGVEPRLLWRGLLDNQYQELPITARTAATADDLPPLRKDPFDRILLAQSLVERVALLSGRPGGGAVRRYSAARSDQRSAKALCPRPSRGRGLGEGGVLRENGCAVDRRAVRR